MLVPLLLPLPAEAPVETIGPQGLPLGLGWQLGGVGFAGLGKGLPELLG